MEWSEAGRDEEDGFPRPGVRWQTAEGEEMRAVARSGRKAFQVAAAGAVGELRFDSLARTLVAFQRRPGRG